MSYTPLQIAQYRVGLSGLVISALSFARLPEVLEYLTRRWKSCQPVESALEWVSIIHVDFIPLLEDIQLARETSGISQEVAKLQHATKRYTLPSRAELPGANVLWRCLILLRIIQIRDRYNKSFFIPWRGWSGRSDMVTEALVEIEKVRVAFSVSVNVPSSQRKGS